MRHTHYNVAAGYWMLSVLAGLLVVWIQPSAATAETHEIGMKDRRFATETLTIKVGDTVKWVNSDHEPHQVVSGQDMEDPRLGDPINADLILIGDSFSHTFEKPGRYPYMCFIHWAKATLKGKVAMSGEIIVEPKTAAEATNRVASDQEVTQ